MMQMDKSDFCEPEAYINFSNSTTPPSIFSHGPILASSSSPPLFNPAKEELMVAMREMIFQIAAMQPSHIDPESIKSPNGRNVKISKELQSVAACQPRERISERIRILQRFVPSWTKMDTAYKQVQSLEQAGVSRGTRVGFAGSHLGNVNYSGFLKPCQPSPMVQCMQMLSWVVQLF
ncbi:hypothetical protein UlMin_012696 [Ulmus minor]